MPQDRSFDPKSRRDGKPRGKPVDPSEKVHDEADPRVDRRRDRSLKDTFPASDPVSINPGAD